jgi:hypothetical protein
MPSGDEEVTIYRVIVMSKHLPPPTYQTQRVFFMTLMVVCALNLIVGLAVYRHMLQTATIATTCPLIATPDHPLNLHDDPATFSSQLWRSRTILMARLFLGGSVILSSILIVGLRYLRNLPPDVAITLLAGGMLMLCLLTACTWLNTPLPREIGCIVIDSN